MDPLRHLPTRIRRHAGAFLVDNAFRAALLGARLHPLSRPSRHGVEVQKDLPYRDGGAPEHRLDIYRPIDRPGPLPIVVYVHGGGFRILSKDSHWIAGLAFARAGYLVFNIGYRLAPRHKYPAAVEDACTALGWVWDHAAEHGGDRTRLALAGESAGANLVTSLAVAASFPREEPWARAIHDRGVRLRAVMAACGLLQVTDPERFLRRRKISSWLGDRVMEPGHAYLGGVTLPPGPSLADPLLILESPLAASRPLPPFYAPVGTRDPLLDDTRRLKAALDRRGVPCQASYFPGGIHAFHFIIPLRIARRCWRETYAFFEQHLQPEIQPR